MEIVNFEYRKPSYLSPLYIDKIDGIAIHHTGNDNSIYTNTDYHIDNNKWSWLGYNYVIEDGIIYKVRGIENMAAGVKGHNNHLISIAVKGDYNKNIPSQKNMLALQELTYYLKERVPNIQSIKPHSFYNDTTCCGKLFPWKTLKLDKPVEYNLLDKVDDMSKEIESLRSKVESNNRTLKRILEVLDDNDIRPKR